MPRKVEVTRKMRRREPVTILVILTAMREAARPIKWKVRGESVNMILGKAID